MAATLRCSPRTQALALSAVVLSMALAGIPGAVLALDKDLATLPITAMVFRPVLLWPNR